MISRSIQKRVESMNPRKGKSKLRSGSGPNPIDVHVGGRVRQRRVLLGLSQDKLGTAVGLTFQQIQKYERGTNRIGASRLYEFCEILNVPVGYFFEGLPSGGPGTGSPKTRTAAAGDSDPMVKREMLVLARAYYRIPDERVRKRIFEMVKAAGALAAD